MNVLFYLIAFELLNVSLIDLKSKKIANYWTLVNILIAIAFYVFGGFAFEWRIFIFPVATIVLGFFLFLAKIMGAGDSKYLASLFIMLPFHYQQIYLENVLLSTILVGGVLFIAKLVLKYKRIKGYALSWHFKGVIEEIRSRFSYAPVLFLAWLLLGKELW